MFQQAVDQFGARILLRLSGQVRVARQQHLRLDVNQHRGHVDEIGSYVHIQFAYLLNVL